MATSARTFAQVDLPSAVGGVSNAIQQIQGTAQANSAFNASQAALNRDWQRETNKIAMDFSAQEAAKNRDWQKMMSDTAHQREIRDLKAAGLNPVLSAMGGNGAAVTSGATASGVSSGGSSASADTSANQAFVGLLGSLLSSQTQLANTATSAMANMAVADKYNATNKYLGELQSETSLGVANINSMANRYAANVHADATKVSAAIHAAAQKYGSDVARMTSNEVAAFNAEVNKELRRMDINANFDLKEQDIYKSVVEGHYKGGIAGSGISWGTISDTLFDLFTGGRGSSARSVAGGMPTGSSTFGGRFTGANGAGRRRIVSK